MIPFLVRQDIERRLIALERVIPGEVSRVRDRWSFVLADPLKDPSMTSDLYEELRLLGEEYPGP